MPQQPNDASHDSRETEGKGPPEENLSEENLSAETPRNSPPPSIPDTILQFLGALPANGNALEWIDAFRFLLEELFEDVDHVELRANLRCPLIQDQPQMLHLPAIYPAAPVRRSRHGVDEALPHIIIVPDDAVEEDRYHEPVFFEYHVGMGYLGEIIFRREAVKEPISAATLSSMAALEPFILFLLSDLVARHAYAKPIGRMFHEVVRGIALERNLTQRELEVLTLHLFGRKYDEISRRLYISVDTVKKHVKRIHRKTESRSAMELFARYFTPLIDLDDPSPPEEPGEEDLDL